MIWNVSDALFHLGIAYLMRADCTKDTRNEVEIKADLHEKLSLITTSL